MNTHKLTARIGLTAAAALAGLVAFAPNSAQASIVGSQGIEIEGPRDRRGFFVSPGISAGASYFSDVKLVYAPMKVDLSFGGGVTKNFTLGINVYVGGYLTSQLRRKVIFGGDVEATGFVYKGLFIRGGLGAAGMPNSAGVMVAGVGGKVGLGYEFWLNQTAAMGIDLSYDLRYVLQDGLRHTPLIGVRFTWY